MEKTKIVLDTNIFINPEARYLLGKTPQEALNNFLEKLKKKKEICCFIPPSVYDELINFIEPQKISPQIILITKKPPSKYEMSVPAIFLYEFIEEMRGRINKGLRIAEKYSRKAQEGSKEEEIIRRLRGEYRVALREGIIDSKEDVDLLLLCKELNAYLVTLDNGLIKWAKKLGITCLSAQELKILLESPQEQNHTH
ncbi:MAG: RNA ligase partner protein [Candidatus Omnitrophica bacterium 4484_70.1]|nr:MAG: RNA ligase partner protein [Candidatus Omnitrophica bacterium 4484_70.1]